MMQRELTLNDYVGMLRRRWVLITAFAVIGSPLAYGLARLLPPKYTSQTLVLVERPAVSPTIVAQVDTTSIGERLAGMKPQILSRTRLEPIIRQFGVYSGEVDRVSMDLLVERLRMEARRLPEGLADESARDAVIDDEVEADLGQGVAQPDGGAVERARLACETGAEIDDRDGFGSASHEAR